MCPSLNFILEIWVNSKDYSEAMDRIQDTPPISLLPEFVGNHGYRAHFISCLEAFPGRGFHQSAHWGSMYWGIPWVCGTYVPEATVPVTGALLVSPPS